MSTFYNPPATRPEAYTHLPGNTSVAPPRDDVPIRNFRTMDPAEGMRLLNADLDMRLGLHQLLRLQNYFRDTARRDPTVGELRLLDGLDRAGKGAPDRVAVGELTTESPALAETWADMMYKHGALHGVGSALQGKRAVTAPPCTLTDALSLIGRYLRRTETRLPPAERLLSAPWQEAVATAEGYTPVARIWAGDATRTLWTRRGEPLTTAPVRAGDLILYLPRAALGSIRALMEGERQKPHPALADIRAVADRSLLLTLLDLCPAADLYADRLGGTAAADGRVPVERLCAYPAVPSDGACDHLLRVPLLQVHAMNETLKALGITAVVLGQVRTKGQTVIHIRDQVSDREIPAVSLPSAFLVSMAAVYLHPFAVEVSIAPAPTPVRPVLTRLPSAVYGEDGVMPDGCETVALTAHDAPILKIPEADLLMSTLSVTISERGTGYAAALETAAAVSDTLAAAGVSPDRMVLSVSLTVGSSETPSDSRIPETICGIYRLAAERSLPVDDPVITVKPTQGENSSRSCLTLTVTAWAVDKDACETRCSASDRQWHTSGLPVGKESPCYLMPVLRHTYEGGLRALAAALNRDCGAGCTVRPVAMDTVEVEIPVESTADGAENAPMTRKETRHTLNPDSVRSLCEQLLQWMTPIFAMGEADTRMLLSEPAIMEALTRLTDLGYPLIVLGESCKPFAEYGFLPAALTEVKTLPAAGTAAVTYSFPADAATRLLRTHLQAPAGRLQEDDKHLLTLRMPDGTSLPDGFIGRNGKVLGLLNGMDTAVLPFLRRNTFDI